MSAGKSASDILAGAKEAVQHADETERLTRPSPTPVPEGLKSPKHEYSDASYSMVKKDKKPGISEELDAKQGMLDKAKQALQ
jgi:hypothetical protein